MATDVEKLIVVLEAKANAFEKQMAKAANVAAQRSGEIKRRFDELNKRSGTAFSGLDGSIARARAGLLQLGAAFVGVQGIEAAEHLADGYTRFANTLKTAGLEGQAFAQVEDGLFAAANRNGVEVESLGQVYARASRAAKSLGATQAQLKTFVDGVSAAVRIQGTSTAAASDALLQLSQGLGSGVFRAEEFNSVLEGLPVIAQAVANNLDVAGGSVARLRTLIADGKVTSHDFFQAFLKGAGQLEGQAAKATLTLSGAFTVLENQLLRGAGAVDKAAGATAILSGAITYLANNLDVAAVALTVIGTALVSRTIPALFAASARMRA
ncbi:tape measure protein, partial [Zavarzinia sp.]|uniref:tape measure protein n=1 Tax=Zavarzinia sp. TaxID=2027920 RepID=UPI003BB65321